MLLRPAVRVTLRPLTMASQRWASSVERLGGPQGVVVLDYKDVASAGTDLSEAIREAYGPAGLGILAVRDVPAFQDKRDTLLPLAFKFAALPDATKSRYEDASSYYSIGWSHGKEKLEGKPDFSKGSYYANPLANRPVEDEELIKRFPAFYAPNLWPSDVMPELEPAFMALGQLIVSVGTKLSLHCDRYVQVEMEARATGSQAPQWTRLHDVLSSSRACKARLLHYFPQAKQDGATACAPGQQEQLSSWCGWHNDHGSLTGLAGGGVYFNERGERVPPPDSKAGLYVKSRNGTVTQVRVPENCMAFQIGETAQVHSGGMLQATPHCVSSGAGGTGVSRSTFAVFMEPEWDMPMDLPRGVDETRLMPPHKLPALAPGVPPLASRWKAGQNFADFTSATLEAYY